MSVRTAGQDGRAGFRLSLAGVSHLPLWLIHSSRLFKHYLHSDIAGLPWPLGEAHLRNRCLWIFGLRSCITPVGAGSDCRPEQAWIGLEFIWELPIGALSKIEGKMKGCHSCSSETVKLQTPHAPSTRLIHFKIICWATQVLPQRLC